MRPLDADYLIVGAGCAGLSLAVHMMDAGLAGRRVLIVDPRTTFPRDRTWCFWPTARHPFETCISHRWTKWRVVTHEQDVVRQASPLAYECLPADQFYELALRRIGEARGVELWTGTSVSHLVDEGDGVRAETDHGSVCARAAFDSRPSVGSTRIPMLRQHFLGWTIESPEAVFDPDVATLMDFRVDQNEGIHFEYILPFSRHRALVEDTFFSPHDFPEERYEERLRSYLRKAGVGSYRILHREIGVLPMDARPLSARPSPHIYRIGLAGGLGRAATGYAFLAIQRFSAALVSRLRECELPEAPLVRSPRTRWLDAIFLSYLRRYPERAPDLFARMFAGTQADVLVRFLSDAGTPLDDMRVMAALPALPFLVESIHAMTSPSRC